MDARSPVANGDAEGEAPKKSEGCGVGSIAFVHPANARQMHTRVTGISRVILQGYAWARLSRLRLSISTIRSADRNAWFVSHGLVRFREGPRGMKREATYGAPQAQWLAAPIHPGQRLGLPPSADLSGSRSRLVLNSVCQWSLAAHCVLSYALHCVVLQAQPTRSCLALLKPTLTVVFITKQGVSMYAAPHQPSIPSTTPRSSHRLVRRSRLGV